MTWCGTTTNIDNPEVGKKVIEDALKRDVIPELRLADGSYLRVVRVRGDKIVGLVGGLQGKWRSINTGDLRGSQVDTWTSIMKQQGKITDPTHARMLEEAEKMMNEDLKALDQEMDAAFMNRWLDSQAEAREDLKGIGSQYTKAKLFLDKFRPARFLLARMYDKKGENLWIKHGVRIDNAIQQMQLMKRQLNQLVWSHAFGHMSEKEARASGRQVFWLLDGSYMSEFVREFGREPTMNEMKAAQVMRAILGSEGEKGLHGIFSVKGFITDYVPHMRRARELQARVIDKALKGEELTDQELREWQKLQEYGIVPPEGINVKNWHKLQRTGGLSFYEDNIFHVFDRYVDMGLREKYFEPIIRDIEKSYGVRFKKHLGKWDSEKPLEEQDVKVLSHDMRTNIGEIEKDTLLQHITSVLGYATDYEIGISRAMNDAAIKLREIMPDSSLVKRLPSGGATFNRTARGLQSVMYQAGLGFRVSSAAKQVTGLPLVFSMLGPKYSTIGMANLFRNPRKAFANAKEAGLFREFLPAKDKDYSVFKTTWKKIDYASMLLFEYGDNGMRVIAFEGGRDKALAQKGRLKYDDIRDPAARNRMDKYKANALAATDAKERDMWWGKFANEYGITASHETQFQYGRGHSPMHFRSDLLRFAGMFMTWPMYFTGNLGHWTYGSYKRAVGKHGLTGRAALVGSAETLARMAPLFVALKLMQSVLEESDTDMSRWMTDMFEVPIRGGPALKIIYDTVNLGNTGAQKMVAELGSKQMQEVANRKFMEALTSWTGSTSLLFPYSGVLRDGMRTKKLWDEHGIRPMFGMRKFTE